MEENMNTCFSFDMLDMMISNSSYRKENENLIWHEKKSVNDQSSYTTFDNSEKIKRQKVKSVSTKNRKKESLNRSEKTNIDNDFLKDIDKNISDNIDSIVDKEINESIDTDLNVFPDLVNSSKKKGKQSNRKINGTKKNSSLKVQKGKKNKIINNNNDSNKKRKSDQTSSCEISESGDLLDMFSLHDEETEDQISEKNYNDNVENNYIDDIEYGICNKNTIVSDEINEKLKYIEQFDKYLLAPSCIGCSNCNYYLKELTSKNYVKFCSMGEYINEGENSLLFLKNQQIQELENANKNLTKEMALFKEENDNLNKKLADFKFEFIEINKKINMLINQNKLLQDINNDLTKNLQKEKQKKHTKSNNYLLSKKKMSEKDFENSIDKELFN
ncbi:conserved Plasmodium protein, unknown function [Plasmodium vinckei vinckei]|uniref:Uncharacterized protein n=1 Tax=Plasmodium vinckei vinckei TaxID=54757 RepID=A0A449BVA7_PLAVN|nr:conserved Plasmodium protein, unknown function [Plasmodium vinckei vinckei]KEG02637.1 hypothetical protein YYE_02466 [Plasmodium vinckei vinckei]VEV57368.1 conserved Plasmodium protein, unknown function [Plasmodium vinckei vinckei]